MREVDQIKETLRVLKDMATRMPPNALDHAIAKVEKQVDDFYRAQKKEKLFRGV